MAKRVAGYQLTAENFDQEEESNEKVQAGQFSKASEDVISKRVIRKAKRRTDEVEASSSPFKGFAGFGTAPSLFGKSTASTSSTFESSKSVPSVTPSFGISFSNANGNPPKNPLGSLKADTGLATFQNKKETEILSTSPVARSGMAKNTSVKAPNSTNGQKKISFSLETSPVKTLNQNDGKDVMFVEQITELNNSVLCWIKQHIEENPLIDLTPVFADYKKYMDEIEEKYGKTETTSAVSGESSGKIEKSVVQSRSPVAVKESEGKPLSLSSTPLFGNTMESKTAEFSTKTPVAGFFSTVQTSTPAGPTNNEGGSRASDKTENDDADDEAPKVERKTIVEADAFHTIRCKLFFKKGQEWKELGVGMLYLKPLNSKTQLLVRMETSGGNIILNICLHPNLPCSRVGKNNISIASVPNPPVFLKPNDGDNSKPVTYLIRVKGTAEADELCKIINDKKTEE